MRVPADCIPHPTRRQALAWGTGCALATAGCEAPRAPMRVGSIVFPGYELLFLARELGLLPPQDLRLVEMSASTDVVRALALGRLEAAALTLDEVLQGRNQGVDLRVILVLDASAGADVVMAGPHVRDLADLKGRRIGFEEGATGAVMMSALLSAARLGPDQVVKVSIALPYSAQAFHKRSLDAVVTTEPWASELETQGARRLFDSSRTPGLIVDVLAVRAEVMALHAASLRTLVAGHLTALARYRADPRAHAAALADRLRMKPEEVPAAFSGLDLPDAAENRRWLEPQGQLLRSAENLGRILRTQHLALAGANTTALADARFLPPP